VPREHFSLWDFYPPLFSATGWSLASEAIKARARTVTDISTTVVGASATIITGRIVTAADSSVATWIHQTLVTEEKLRFTNIDTIILVAIELRRPGQCQGRTDGEKNVGHIDMPIAIFINFAQAVGHTHGGISGSTPQFPNHSQCMALNVKDVCFAIQGDIAANRLARGGRACGGRSRKEKTDERESRKGCFDEPLHFCSPSQVLGGKKDIVDMGSGLEGKIQKK
jgi:hypothetical protein